MSEVTRELLEKNFHYKYPYGLNFRPSSELHRKIVGRLMDLAHESQGSLSARWDSWRLMDEKMTAYLPATELERKEKIKDRRKPIAVVFPTMFAAADTILTYGLSTYFEPPVFRYKPVGPEAKVGLLQRRFS